MKNLKIKLNKKHIDATFAFIQEKFGKVDSYVELNSFNFPFRVFCIKPTEEKPYYTLITMGLQLLKFSHFPKTVEGMELFVRLPKDWNYTQQTDYNEGWVWNVILSIAESLLRGEAMVPGSTYKFAKLNENSKQDAVIVNYPFGLGEETTILKLKKTDILFLEIQTLYNNEWDQILGHNEKIVDLVYSLPYVDLKRESFVRE